MKFIDLNRQYEAYKEELDQAVMEVMASGQFILGKAVEDLENTLSQYVGSRFGIGVSSGTDGLMLALMAYNVGPGDEVITTPFTFIATAEVISFLGAVPIFVDIDPETYNIDVGSLRETIASRKKQGAKLKGIIAVSLYGQCADMDEINEIARQEGLFVIEDGCQSFGATYKSRRSCGLSHVGVTSFFPSKPLGCYGDGGMVFTDDEDVAETIKALRVHGQKKRYLHERIGLNARFDAIQAVIVGVKFRHFDKEVAMRQNAAAVYDDLFREKDVEVVTPKVKEDRTSVYAQYTIALPEEIRDMVQESLNKASIPTAIHYPMALHMQPPFKHLGQGPFPNAEKASRQVLSLPMHPFITAEEQELVVDAVVKAF